MRWLRGLVRGLAAEGRTVLVSSHLLAEVAQLVTPWRGRVVAAKLAASAIALVAAAVVLAGGRLVGSRDLT